MNKEIGIVKTTIVGASNMYEMAVFFNALGMVTRTAPELLPETADALYGIPKPLQQLIVATPGSDSCVRIVETPYAAKPFQPLMVGPYGLDVYSTDIQTSINLARQTGAYATELVKYDIHGEVLQSEAPQFESRYVGPDALSVYVSDIAVCGHRFPTILDGEPRRLHSEVNMLVWVVEDQDAAKAFWTEEAGLQVVVDRYEGEEGMIDLMAHPYETPLRVVNVTDAAKTRRMEFMCYTDAKVGRRPDWPLQGGLHAAGIHVADLDAAMKQLPSAEFRDVVEMKIDGRIVRGVAGKAPGDTMFELWEMV